MKKYLIILFIGLLISCGKEGPVGPEGEQGIQGAQGISGKDGSTILSGTSNPNTSIGKDGDFYLNLTNGNLYGPKNSAGWGTPFSMKGLNGNPGEDGAPGKDGIDGKDGASILNGKTDPTKTQGKLGDFYLNTSDYTMFGPKKSSGDWGTGVNLMNTSKAGLIIFGVNPFFNVDIKSQYVDGKGYHITAKSKIFKLDFENDRILDFYIANVGRLVEVSFAENVWEKYTGQLSFNSIAVGIDTQISDVKINTIINQPKYARDSYTVQYTIEYYSSDNYVQSSLAPSGITFQIRATPLESVKYLSQKSLNVNLSNIVNIK